MEYYSEKNFKKQVLRILLPEMQSSSSQATPPAENHHEPRQNSKVTAWL
jgi:hypothetical protein